MKGVYIHIPFCKQICSYCDFCKVFYYPKWIQSYLKQLQEEISDRYMGERIDTIYIGGGTPSSLRKKELLQLNEILAPLKQKWLEEFTFECNLQDINEELLDTLTLLGVNRLSIGIESFQKEKLKMMGRSHTYQEAQEKINLCRTKGFHNINLDLMYALPHETKAMLKKDLQLFLKLNPEHISTYSLQFEDHTLLTIQGYQPLLEDEDRELYDIICKTLKGKYEHYELSNFSKKGYQSKHNLKYWKNQEYYGFGLSSAGYIEGIRYTNTKSLKNYCNGQFIDEQNLLSLNDKMDHEIMLGLRLTQGIHKREFQEKYGIDIKEAYPIDALLKKKELEENKEYIFIPAGKLYIMNEILIHLL